VTPIISEILQPTKPHQPNLERVGESPVHY